MKTLIIEDEALVARDLQKLIHQIDDKIEILEQIPSLEAAKKWFKENPPPDLLFMDIQLADGVSFDLFSEVEIDCPIIFTTAYNEYAIRAFKVNSIDYLLKPIDKKDLEKAFEKFKKLQKSENSLDIKIQLNDLFKDFADKESLRKYKERFLVHTKNTLVPLPAEQIAYFLKDEIIFIVTFDNKRYVCDYQTMDEIEELLNPTIFYRANRQYILHINSVDNLKSTYKGLTIKLKSPLNVELDISREKATLFKNWLG